MCSNLALLAKYNHYNTTTSAQKFLNFRNFSTLLSQTLPLTALKKVARIRTAMIPKNATFFMQIDAGWGMSCVDMT
jgi:hypothetical protein